jgi:hypothetical protein
VGYEDYDYAAQIAVSHHFWASGGELMTFSSPHRYVWPSELDLMAQLAGMRLRQRWSDWNRNEFTSDSRSHISVWQSPIDGDSRHWVVHGHRPIARAGLRSGAAAVFQFTHLLPQAV